MIVKCVEKEDGNAVVMRLTSITIGVDGMWLHGHEVEDTLKLWALHAAAYEIKEISPSADDKAAVYDLTPQPGATGAAGVQQGIDKAIRVLNTMVKTRDTSCVQTKLDEAAMWLARVK